MSSIADYQQLAQQKLPAEVWRYLSDGAGAGRTMAANHAALNDTSLMTRPLADVSAGHTRSKLFGQDYAHPLLLAPITYQRQFHADGELAAAMAVEAQGAPYIVSSLARMTIDSIARSGAALCFQLYWQGSRGETVSCCAKRWPQVARPSFLRLTHRSNKRVSTCHPASAQSISKPLYACRLSQKVKAKYLTTGWRAHRAGLIWSG